jgi:hypothetical protein
MRLKHQIKRAGLGEFTATFGASAFTMFFGYRHVISTKALFALLAVNHGIAKARHMTRGHPGARMGDYARVHAHDIVALLHHLTPPRILDSPFKLYAGGAKIPEPVDPTVNFARLKYEASPFAQRYQSFHLNHTKPLFIEGFTKRAVWLTSRAKTVKRQLNNAINSQIRRLKVRQTFKKNMTASRNFMPAVSIEFCD